MIPSETWNDIWEALDRVTIALSKVPDSDRDWNQVTTIQAYVNESQEIISSILDDRGETK